MIIFISLPSFVLNPPMIIVKTLLLTYIFVLGKTYQMLMNMQTILVKHQHYNMNEIPTCDIPARVSR